MLSYFILILFSLNFVDCLNKTQTNILSIEKLLHKQYDQRQLINNTNRTITPIYSSKKSNSIEILKKFIANRQRSLTSRYSSSIQTTTDSFITSTYLVRIKSKIDLTIAQTNESSTTSTLQTTSSSSSSNTTILIIILVSTFSGFLFLSLIFTFLLRRRITIAYFKLPCIHSSSNKHSQTTTPLSHSPIHSKFTIPEDFPVEKLYDIYMQKHAFDDLAFAIEFKNIPNFDELPCTSATRTIVASKNRFLNILPIDATRVILNLINNDPSTDYINGNYISGYKCSNKFIATQGPKPDTCEDFWRMMWELKLKSIVMLTNVIEGASRMTKCHQYWPDLGQTITYGHYRITCFDIITVEDYEKRYFHLIKCQEDIRTSMNDNNISLSTLNDHQTRLIIQYHFTQWKDMDVPNDSHSLLHLIHDVNEQTKSEQYPIVVHCTAGVGRTGTYIAIDAMIDKIEQEGKLNIYDFVLKMRRERCLMVQTVRQYVFIYRSLLEYYLYGNTRIEAHHFRSTYMNLKRNKQTLLVAEYNKLSLLPVENISQRDAHLADNIDKNRHPKIVPYDRNRVCLSRILGHPYINASIIEGYSRECSFIITQDPLLETIHEFWRMFIEHNSNCIVQLHTIQELSPKCPIYYPNDFDTTMKIGSTTLIKLIQKEYLHEKILYREFCLTDTREALSKTIVHFEYLQSICTNDDIDLNQQCLPTIISNNLFDFIGYINKRQNLTNHDHLITVHCGNGGPACSLFCMCVMLLDQLKTEHAVDIFQRVRILQRQRYAMINSLAQYEYLYEMISKFLEDSFDLTAAKSSPSLNNSVYDNNMIDSDDHV